MGAGAWNIIRNRKDDRISKRIRYLPVFESSLSCSNLNIHKKLSDRSTILILILNLKMQILIQAEGDLKVIVQSRIAPPTVFSQHK